MISQGPVDGEFDRLFRNTEVPAVAHSGLQTPILVPTLKSEIGADQRGCPHCSPK